MNQGAWKRAKRRRVGMPSKLLALGAAILVGGIFLTIVLLFAIALTLN